MARTRATVSSCEALSTTKFRTPRRQRAQARLNLRTGVVRHEDDRAARHDQEPRIIIFLSRHPLLSRCATPAPRLRPCLEIVETSLPGVLLIKPRVFQDPRGFFLETYRADELAAAGVHETFVQDNHSRSSRGVLRGLHYQFRHAAGQAVPRGAGRSARPRCRYPRWLAEFRQVGGRRLVGLKTAMESRGADWHPARLGWLLQRQ